MRKEKDKKSRKNLPFNNKSPLPTAFGRSHLAKCGDFFVIRCDLANFCWCDFLNLDFFSFFNQRKHSHILLHQLRKSQPHIEKIIENAIGNTLWNPGCQKSWDLFKFDEAIASISLVLGSSCVFTFSCDRLSFWLFCRRIETLVSVSMWNK